MTDISRSIIWHIRSGSDQCPGVKVQSSKTFTTQNVSASVFIWSFGMLGAHLLYEFTPAQARIAAASGLFAIASSWYVSWLSFSNEVDFTYDQSTVAHMQDSLTRSSVTIPIDDEVDSYLNQLNNVDAGDISSALNDTASLERKKED